MLGAFFCRVLCFAYGPHSSSVYSGLELEGLGLKFLGDTLAKYGKVKVGAVATLCPHYLGS